MSRKRRKQLREEMRRVLARLDKRWVKAASGEICEKLSHIVDHELEDRRISRVLAWSNFFPGEIDLTSFIGDQLERDREVYLPRSLPDLSMTFISVGPDWSSTIAPGEAGIPEPQDLAGEVYNATGCEDTVVIVPGLVFDRRGNRLGRGRGYYDRFLSQRDLHDAVKIGVLWQLQLIDEVPADSHDIAMDWVCHEEGFERTGLDFGEDLEEEDEN